MKNRKNDWKSIIKNPGVIETSFGSISFLPPVQNIQKDYIHPPVKVSSLITCTVAWSMSSWGLAIPKRTLSMILVSISMATARVVYNI